MFGILTLLIIALTSPRLTAGASAVRTPAAAVPAPAPPYAEAVLPGGFAPGRAPFEVRFGDTAVAYDVLAVFALPGERVGIRIPETSDAVTLEADGGALAADSGGAWSWRAPDHVGTATLRARRSDGAMVTLNAFVMAPYATMTDGRIEGYRIGPYPAPVGTHASVQGRPRGFVRLDGSSAALAVSPHLTLGQFACKAGDGYPKYLVVQPRLITRLETLLEATNRRGIPASTFALMSAYRTPLYNRGIGNPTTFTRHQYGDAADIFIDEDGDGHMDDLNGDGRSTRADAAVLQRLADSTEGTPEADGLVGGLSAYAPTDAHGPFVHVDTRGYRARW